MLDCRDGYRCDENCSPGGVMYECTFVRQYYHPYPVGNASQGDTVWYNLTLQDTPYERQMQLVPYTRSTIHCRPRLCEGADLQSSYSYFG